jgi:hypothetical protein
VDNVALVFLVRETLGGGPVAFGLVSAAFGVGMISASLGLSIRRTSVAVTTLLIVAWLASGFGTVANGLAPLIAVSLPRTGGGWFRQRPREHRRRHADQQAARARCSGGSSASSPPRRSAGAHLPRRRRSLDLSSPARLLIAGAGILAVTASSGSPSRRSITGPQQPG